MKKLIGIDIGTSNIKAELYDIEGNILDTVSKSYSTYFGAGNIAEQDARDWENVSIEILNFLFDKYDEIEAIGMSTQGGTLVLTDKGYNPIRRAITWMDARASDEKSEILEKISVEKIYRITGWKLLSILPLLQINWLKKNEPDNFSKANNFMFVGDYMQQKLCGRSLNDYSSASISMLFDINKKNWSDELLEVISLDRKKLNNPSPSDEIIGLINSKNISNKSKKTIMSNSAHDQYCVALSSNIEEGNKLLLSTGTAWAIFKNTDKPFFNKYFYSPGVHILPDTYGLMSVVPTGGTVFNWFLNTFFENGKDSKIFLQDTEEDFEKITNIKNKCIFVPLFSGMFGPYWNSEITGSIENLTFDSDRVNIYKAVLEGVSFQFKWITESLKEIGVNFDSIKIIGGAAKSKIQCQIISDITGYKVIRPKNMKLNYACRGAAMIAGVSSKTYKDFNEASRHFKELEEEFYPNGNNLSFYENKYEMYKNAVFKKSSMAK